MRRFLTLATYTPPFYAVCIAILRGILNLVARWQVTGRENVPGGGVLVVSNHLNIGDPPIMGAAIPHRRIRYMAKIELFQSRLGWIIRLWGAFPVRRFDSDMGALLTAERLLRDGHPVGMFPEGTRSRNQRIGTMHPGTALIALRSGAPLLPCAITGTEHIRSPLLVFRRPRITIRIGTPIAVQRTKRPTEAQIAALMAEVTDAITALLPPAYGGTYTGK